MVLGIIMKAMQWAA